MFVSANKLRTWEATGTRKERLLAMKTSHCAQLTACPVKICFVSPEPCISVRPVPRVPTAVDYPAKNAATKHRSSVTCSGYTAVKVTC